jgi:hypothetical protein
MKTVRRQQMAEEGPTSKNPPIVLQSGRVWQNFRRRVPRSWPDKFSPRGDRSGEIWHFREVGGEGVAEN